MQRVVSSPTLEAQSWMSGHSFARPAQPLLFLSYFLGVSAFESNRFCISSLLLDRKGTHGFPTFLQASYWLPTRGLGQQRLPKMSKKYPGDHPGVLIMPHSVFHTFSTANPWAIAGTDFPKGTGNRGSKDRPQQ